MSELTNRSGANSSEGLFNEESSAPSSEFLLVDEESSTYPLLTPSPPADFDHPLAIDTLPVLAYERQLSPSSIDTDLSSIPTLSGAAQTTTDYGALARRLPPPQAESQPEPTVQGKSSEDSHNEIASSSSSSSVLQEAGASAQLLNPHHYLGMSGDTNCQENGGVKPALCGITLGIKKNPQDFCFLNWNWSLIRKCCFWGMMSLTIACVCVIIGYITALPNRCDPPRSWYQGSLIYEIFPGSFYDSDGDGEGDLKGITAKVHYLESMGVRGVRLNSIFPSEHYPEHYYDVENLTQIEPSLGSIADFRLLVKTFHEMNISLILDLPLGPFFKHLEESTKLSSSGFHSHHVIINNHILNSNPNRTMYSVPDLHGTITEILQFWLNEDVDGFYLKDLEALVHDDKIQQHVREWKNILKKHNQGFEKILVCSEKVIKVLENDDLLSSKLATFLTHFDLVEYLVEVTEDLKGQIDSVQQGVLFSRPGYPWPLWSLGGVDTSRLASRLPIANASLAAILVGLMLPGTPSLFYGDEIGLDNLLDSEKDFRDLSHVHQLGMMHWHSNPPRTLHWLPDVQAHLSLDSGRWVAETAALRENSPSIYMYAVWRDNNLVANCLIKYVDKTMIVLERLYPRRHSYVIVANLGKEKETRDFSKLFYGGHVVLSTCEHKGKYVTFQRLTLLPGEAIIVELDK